MDQTVHPIDLKRLRETLAADSGWLWEAGPDLRFLWISDALRSATGLIPGDLVAKADIRHLARNIHGDEERNSYLAALDRFEVFRDVICQIEGGDGHPHWICITGEPRFDKAGAFLGYSGQGRDITHLTLEGYCESAAAPPKRTLAADLQLALDALPMGVVILDDKLNTQAVNQAYYDIWRVTPDDVPAGSHYRRFIDVTRRMGIQEVQQGEWDAQVERILDEIRSDTSAPRELLLSDGRSVIFDVRPLSNNKRLATYFDVTDQAQREKAARQTSALLESMIESMPASVVIYDAEDRFVLANDRVKQMFPWLAPALVPGAPVRDGVALTRAMGYCRTSGDPSLDALYDDQPEAWIDEYTKRYMSAPKTYERKESDGGWSQVIDCRAPDGTFIGMRVDITKLKQRERELTEAEQRAVLADRVKSEFLANMSHEIRTPMNGVLGMAELLSRTELDCRQRAFADIIVKSGNALLTIINDILDFSKIDAGQVELDPAPFNLSEAVEDVVTLMSTRAKEKDLELIVRVDPGLPRRFVGDVGRIRQIIINLVGNAIKFTDVGHVLVDVGGTAAGDKFDLSIAVSDTGIGIPADKLQLVFDKFSQVDASSTRRHEGTGLGLAITERLVNLMDGAISVESEPGNGSTFTVRLRLPRAPSEVERLRAPLDISGARVLVVDDNAINRAILMEQMESWKFNACAAVDGKEALKVLATVEELGSHVDCAVLDFQMPGMTGHELARHMRENRYFDAMPIILLSSVDEPASTYRDVDIDAHLVKPTRASALFDAIVSAIEARRGKRGEAGPPASVASAQRLEPHLKIVASGKDRKSLSQRQVDILVAEDNEVNQLVFSQILGETSFSFEIVADGEKAVKAYATLRPRMVLMDVSMPRMNGLEATEAIRAIEVASGGRASIVGVTAHALNGDRERCLEAGMDDYLPKPISPNALMAKIDTWLGQDVAVGQAD